MTILFIGCVTLFAIYSAGDRRPDIPSNCKVIIISFSSAYFKLTFNPDRAAALPGAEFSSLLLSRRFFEINYYRSAKGRSTVNLRLIPIDNYRHVCLVGYH